jgi:hypothetical protein
VSISGALPAAAGDGHHHERGVVEVGSDLVDHGLCRR